eukprot:CAMPEP_0170140416 /NCGR_PEP_ID=MMETSP0033_2-20121228/6339_1 /TAXON_ID=195969 /ORGANISM="Dolichomastix tenuilepis, Strain CCMP3274" /LENGTH=105 /DNA_ID=CAMNT_0010376629 /DNA_START=54 /DNA_END=367 /DNA_ORIENTATION=-
MAAMNNEEAVAWLEENGLERTARAFRAQNLDGGTLEELHKCETLAERRQELASLGVEGEHLQLGAALRVLFAPRPEPPRPNPNTEQMWSVLGQLYNLVLEHGPAA